MAQDKTAYQRHSDTLIRYLSDWANPWPNRDQMPKICGIKARTLREHFKPHDFQRVEAEGLALRRKFASRPLGTAMDALTKEAKKGNVKAIKELFDRIEGKVIEKRELTGKDGKELFPELPEAERKILAEIAADGEETEE